MPHFRLYRISGGSYLSDKLAKESGMHIKRAGIDLAKQDF
jgi:hypothetical protein